MDLARLRKADRASAAAVTEALKLQTKLREEAKRRTMTPKQRENARRTALYSTSASQLQRTRKAKKQSPAVRTARWLTGEREPERKNPHERIEERLAAHRLKHSQPWRPLRVKTTMPEPDVVTNSRPEDAAAEPQEWRPPLQGNPHEWPDLTTVTQAHEKMQKEMDMTYKWMTGSTDPRDAVGAREPWAPTHRPTSAHKLDEFGADPALKAKKEREAKIEFVLRSENARRPQSAPAGGRRGSGGDSSASGALVTPRGAASTGMFSPGYIRPPPSPTMRQRMARTRRGHTRAAAAKERPKSAALRLATYEPSPQVRKLVSDAPPPEAETQAAVQGRFVKGRSGSKQDVALEAMKARLAAQEQRDKARKGIVEADDVDITKPLEFNGNFGCNPAVTTPAPVGRFAQHTRSSVNHVSLKRRTASRGAPSRREQIESATNERLALTGEAPVRVGGAVQVRSTMVRRGVSSGSTLLYSGKMRRNEVEVQLGKRGAERQRRIQLRAGCIKWLTHHPVAQRLDWGGLLKKASSRVVSDRAAASASQINLLGSIQQSHSMRRMPTAHSMRRIGTMRQGGKVVLSRAQFIRVMRSAGFESQSDLRHVNAVFSSYDIDVKDRIDMSFFCAAYTKHFSRKRGVVFGHEFSGDRSSAADRRTMNEAHALGGEEVARSILGASQSQKASGGHADDAAAADDWLAEGLFYRSPSSVDVKRGSASSHGSHSSASGYGKRPTTAGAQRTGQKRGVRARPLSAAPTRGSRVRFAEPKGGSLASESSGDAKAWDPDEDDDAAAPGGAHSRPGSVDANGSGSDSRASPAPAADAT